MLSIDTEATADWPDATDWAALAETAVIAALRHSPQGRFIAEDARFSVSVRLSDDAEVQQLNAAYRHKDAPTNVLSFPMVQPDLLPALANTDDGEVLLGDMILAAQTCQREAADKGIALADHTTHLIVHGTLHLIGYDHQNDAEAEAMEALETKALASLGLADPYS